MVIDAETASRADDLPPEDLGRSLDSRRKVLATLSSTWRLGNAPQLAADIDGEAAIFLAGHGASLPYFSRDSVLWVTVAPSLADLHREIDLLRAWVIPSYAWEDSKEPFVVPGEGSGDLSKALFSVSPAGYFRWRCSRPDVTTVAARLGRMRGLLALRPQHLLERVPSLLEFRQQFRIALITGDREAAEEVVSAIDHYQIDSAVNTQLMRVTMHDRFGEYPTIVADPALDRLLSIRMPPVVRTGVIRAFHAVHLVARELEGSEAAASAYAERVHTHIGGLLALAVPQDGPEVARSLAYRAFSTRDAEQAAELLPFADDFVAPLLRSLLTKRPTKPESSGDLFAAFRAAVEREDVRAIQSLSPAILAMWREGNQMTGIDVIDVVRGSLDTLPNLKVAEDLARVVVSQPIPITSLPQSWRELVEQLRTGNWASAERFLALDYSERPSPDRLPPDELEAAIATLEELLTHPVFGPKASEQRVTQAALPAFIEDFISDPQFPRRSFALLYLQLLRLWVEHRRGSAYPPDGHLLLVLAMAVLEHSAGKDQEIAQALVDWWRARPVRSALPFLLEAVEIVVDLTVEEGFAQQLWLDGASLLSRESEGLAPSERALWRRLGLRAGFDSAALGEVLPLPAAVPDTQPPVDPLRQLKLERIAIVSLHQRSAEEAQALLTERTDATVFLVNELVAGPATRRAQSADVILFVWAATKHAVFRAFDSVRDRMVYVQGSGAGSIVLALERWAVKRMENAT